LNFSTARLRLSGSGRSWWDAEAWRGGEKARVGDGDVAEEEGVAIWTRGLRAAVDDELEGVVAVEDDEERVLDVAVAGGQGVRESHGASSRPLQNRNLPAPVPVTPNEIPL
jgi:hypothetical protein